jgi:hypothetical protein
MALFQTTSMDITGLPFDPAPKSVPTDLHRSYLEVRRGIPDPPSVNRNLC